MSTEQSAPEGAQGDLATENARLRTENARLTEHLKTAVWSDSEECKLLTAENERLRAAITNPSKHKFWGAGEPDCPTDIKASNGELHTLRCKVCGGNGRDPICHAAFAPAPQDGDACDAIYWKEKAIAAIAGNKTMLAALDDIATDTREHGDDEVAIIYRMQDRAKAALSEIRGQSSDARAALKQENTDE